MAEISATYVVLGGGIAGVSCAETLCHLTSETGATILLVSGSELVRMAANVAQLTQTLVQFDVQESTGVELQDKTPGLKVITAVSITNFDPSNKKLLLSDGTNVTYEKSVCICTGARPRVLPGAANCEERILTLRDVESVHSLQEKLKDAKRVVIVGNGGIATELVYKVRGVQEVKWIVRDKHISAAFVDPGAAQFFLSSGVLTEAGAKPPEPVIKRLRYTGAGGEHTCMGAALGPDWHSSFDIQGPQGETKPTISVEYETEVQQIIKVGDEGFPESETSWPLALRLSSGKVLGCDLVIAATGVVPNCDMFENILDIAPISEGGGIRVDKAMHTSVPGVFAAGDVVCASWPKDKYWFQMRLWTQARQMGNQAARAMADPETASMFDFSFEMFAHITRFFGYKLVLLGLHNGQGLAPGSWEALVRVTPGREYIKLVLADGKVHGAVLVGDTELEETCENLILNQTDVAHLGDDLLNPDVDIEDYFD